jgi:hypothetical protein
MKRFFPVLFMFFCLTAQSQVKFGIQAGATFSGYKSTTDDGVVLDYKMLTGYQGGGFAEITLNNYFSVQPGLMFSTRGAKVKFLQTFIVPSNTGYSTVNVTLKATITPLYIDVPLFFKVSFASVGSDKFTIGVGPLFSYGVGGKMKIKGNLGSTGITGEAKVFSDGTMSIKDQYNHEYSDGQADALLKRFDIGASCFAAYEFNQHILLNIGYQHGLRDIRNDSGEKLRNRCLTIMVGYKF